MDGIIVWIPEVLNAVSLGMVISAEKESAQSSLLVPTLAFNVMLLMLTSMFLLYTMIRPPWLQSRWIHLFSKTWLLISCVSNIIVCAKKNISITAVAVQSISFVVGVLMFILSSLISRQMLPTPTKQHKSASPADIRAWANGSAPASSSTYLS